MWGRRGRIFISYRRDDAPGEARSIRDRLVREFGKSRVFMDVDDLFAGQRFDVELEKALGGCEVLVVVIGPRWTSTLSEHSARRERDYVREEIVAALKRGIRIIPALVGREGKMPDLPRRQDLPKDIRDFVLFQKQNLMHESFSRDAAELAEAIRSIRAEKAPNYFSVRAAAAVACSALILGLPLYLVSDSLSFLRISSVAYQEERGLLDTSQAQKPHPPMPSREREAAEATALKTGPVVQSEVSLPVRTYFVQISSHQSEVAARGGFASQKMQHPELLGPWEVAITRADLGPSKGVWYRSRIGPFFSEVEASAFCSRLRAAQINCQFPPPP